MRVGMGDAEFVGARGQRIFASSGTGGPNEFEGAETEAVKRRCAGLGEFAGHERSIEREVVGREDRAVELSAQFGSDLEKFRSVGKILRRDAMDVGGTGIAFGIDERRPFGDLPARRRASDHGDLDDAIGGGVEPGGLDIEYGERPAGGAPAVALEPHQTQTRGGIGSGFATSA